MTKPNYSHAKRQKEALRKARQEARLQRRQARRTADSTPEAADAIAATGSAKEAKP